MASKSSGAGIREALAGVPRRGVCELSRVRVREGHPCQHPSAGRPHSSLAACQPGQDDEDAPPVGAVGMAVQLSGLSSFLDRTEHLTEDQLCRQHTGKLFDEGP